MRIFVLGLPHTQTTTEFCTCAYTMKVWNLCKMMHDRGHEVIHLGVEGSNPVCSEHVTIVPLELWEKLYGHPGTNQYTTRADGKYRPLHKTYADNGRSELLQRTGERYSEIICLPWGGCQIEAVKDVPQNTVESGIGYHITGFCNYRVFESYAWMHFHMGRVNKHDGNTWYDVVIPNAFDPEMFPFSDSDKRKDEFLFIGRLNHDKGINIAIDATKRAGKRLLIVGQGDPSPFVKNNDHVTYMPPVGVEERMDLMGSVRAAFVPTQYLEPFGGVNVELQMTGCPVITTDWGAFNETVLHGVTGFRCRTMEQFVWATRNIGKIEPAACRFWALNNYSLGRIAPMYEEFFQMVLNLRGEGYYQEFEDRKQLSWMQKQYPPAATARIEIPVKHHAPKVKTAWEMAHKWESDWWGLERNERWEEEEKKQVTYARLMGLPTDMNLKEARVLDVGCGPTSMLLRAKHGESTGLDPLPMSDDVKKAYEDKGIKLVQEKAENFVGGPFDEGWMYNCLQHTDDPTAILKMLDVTVRVVRIFEWINMGVCPGHPHNLTEELFENAFPKRRWERRIWNTGVLKDFGGTATNNYIAIHAVRRCEPDKRLERIHRLASSLPPVPDKKLKKAGEVFKDEMKKWVDEVLDEKMKE